MALNGPSLSIPHELARFSPLHAELSSELEAAAEARDAAAARLAAVRASGTARHGEVAALEAEAARLREEAAAAEASVEAAVAAARDNELALAAKLRDAESAALSREAEARASCDAKRAQLAQLQASAAAARERLAQKEVLAQAGAELRARLAATGPALAPGALPASGAGGRGAVVNALALHNQLQSVLAENRAAGSRLAAQLAALGDARVAAAAALDAAARERDALQRVRVVSNSHSLMAPLTCLPFCLFRYRSDQWFAADN